jgi:hypothetical protein
MADTADAESEGEEEEVPRRFVSEYFTLEEEVLQTLDEVRKEQLKGNQMQARETLRTLAESREDAFKAISYAVVGTEDFFEDIKEQVGTEAANELKNRGEEYQDLKIDLQAVNREQMGNRKLPITDISGDFFSRSSDPYPVFESSVKSASVEVFSVRDRPWKFLNLSWELADGVSIILANEDKDVFPEDEIDSIREHLDNLREIVGDIEEELEKYEGDHESESDSGNTSQG